LVIFFILKYFDFLLILLKMHYDRNLELILFFHQDFYYQQHLIYLDILNF